MLKSLILKDYKYYLFTPVGYVFASLLLGVSAWLYFGDFFVINQVQIESFVANIVFIMALFIPALAMSAFADEKKNGTWEVLLTTRVTEEKLVLGKFFGALLAIITFLLGILPIVAINLILGKPDVGVMIAQIMGMILIAGVYLSVTIFASSLSGQGIVAFFIASVIIIINSLFSQNAFITRLPGSVAYVLEKMSWQGYMNEFSNGLIRLSSASVLVTSICVFLILTIAKLKQRNV